VSGSVWSQTIKSYFDFIGGHELIRQKNTIKSALKKAHQNNMFSPIINLNPNISTEDINQILR
jgi:hypothetical protein